MLKFLKNNHHAAFLIPLFVLTLVLIQSSFGTLPDQYFGPVRMLASFLASLFFLYSIWLWGELLFQKCLRQKIEGGLTLNFALGILILVALIGLFGHLGLIGYRYNYLFVALLIFPQIYFYLKRSSPPFLFQFKQTLENIFNWDKNYIFLNLSCLGIAVFCLIQCGFFTMIRDIYNYHLAVPRVWWSNGMIENLPNFPLAYHASWIEYLYMWGFPLLSVGTGKGLFSVLFFSQFLHFFLGIFSTFLVLNNIGKYFFEKEKEVVCLLSLMASACYWLLWTSYTAKTDWILIFISLTSLQLIIEHYFTSNKIKLFLAALFLGLALMAKVSTVFFVLTMVTVVLSLNLPSGLKGLKQSAFFLLGLLPFSVPIMLRNYSATQNPFFPILSNVFPTPALSQTWLQVTRSFEFSKIDDYFSFFSHWMEQLFFSDFLLFILPLTLFFIFSKKRQVKALGIIALNLLFWIVLFLLKTGRGGLTFVHFRLLGPVLVLGDWLGASFLYFITKNLLGRKKNLQIVLINSLALLWIFRPFMPWGNLLQLIHYRDPGTVFTSNYDSGGCRTWLTKNIPSEVPLYFMDFGMYYFMYNHQVTLLDSNPAIDNPIFFLKTGEERAKKLKELGVKILYTHFSPEGVHYSKYSKEITHYLKQYPQTIIHDGELCLVFDLSKASFGQ